MCAPRVECRSHVPRVETSRRRRCATLNDFPTGRRTIIRRPRLGPDLDASRRADAPSSRGTTPRPAIHCQRLRRVSDAIRPGELTVKQFDDECAGFCVVGELEDPSLARLKRQEAAQLSRTLARQAFRSTAGDHTPVEYAPPLSFGVAEHDLDAPPSRSGWRTLRHVPLGRVRASAIRRRARRFRRGPRYSDGRRRAPPRCRFDRTRRGELPSFPRRARRQRRRSSELRRR